jgi:hypothetical protein
MGDSVTPFRSPKSGVGQESKATRSVRFWVCFEAKLCAGYHARADRLLLSRSNLPEASLGLFASTQFAPSRVASAMYEYQPIRDARQTKQCERNYFVVANSPLAPRSQAALIFY